MDWNDMALVLSKTAEQINKKRETEKRSEQRAKFKASSQGKIATYRRYVREQKKALRLGDDMKVWLWQMRVDKALEDMDSGDKGKARAVGQTKGAALHPTCRGAELAWTGDVIGQLVPG